MGDNASSPVVSVMLMIAIVIAMAAVIVYAVDRLQTPEEPEFAGHRFKESNDRLYLDVISADLPADEMVLRLWVDDVAIPVPQSAIDAVGPDWTGGDRICLIGIGCLAPTGEAARVQLIADGTLLFDERWTSG